MSSRGVACTVSLAAMLMVGCAAIDPRDAGTPQEKRALASFRLWLKGRTTARLIATGTETTQQPPSQTRWAAVGVLDFRYRRGEVTTTRYGAGSDSGGRAKSRQIYWGDDTYVSIPSIERSTSARDIDPAAHSRYSWSISSGKGSSFWSLWLTDEKALDRVHAAGRSILPNGPAHEFAGQIDVVTHKTITGPPETGCWSPSLRLDLYIDDHTGKLVRYDRELLSSPIATSKGVAYHAVDSFADFGTQPPQLSPPAPSSVEPPISMPSGGVTFKATADAQSC